MSKTKTFKKGDRVVVMDPHDESVNGKTGTVQGPTKLEMLHDEITVKMDAVPEKDRICHDSSKIYGYPGYSFRPEQLKLTEE